MVISICDKSVFKPSPIDFLRTGDAFPLHAFTGELRFRDRLAQYHPRQMGQLLARLKGRKLRRAVVYGIA